MQARGCKPTKGNVQQIRGPGPSRVVFSFPLSKPLLQSMYQGSLSPCTLSFSCSLLGSHSLGMTMSVLHFLYVAWPYPWNVGNVCFTFLLCVIVLYMMYVCMYICVCVCVCVVRDVSLKKKRFGYLFRVPLFLGKWYGVATYFSLYKKKEKKKY